MSERLESLIETLQAAGFTGEVALLKQDDPSAHNRLAPSTYHTISNRIIRLDWPNGTAPTQGQRNGADAIIQAFDFRPRRPRGLAAIAVDIRALSNSDKQRLQEAALADFLQNNPRFANRLNINISGDKPEE